MVCDKVVCDKEEAAEEEEDEEAEGVQNKKQEPPTKMWRASYPNVIF